MSRVTLVTIAKQF